EILDFGKVPKKDFVKYFRITAKTNMYGKDYWLYDYCTKEDFGNLLYENAFKDVRNSVQEKLCMRYYWSDSENSI
ncbi:MAG: hypothetical protein MJ158_00390, partial [Alphaproteobacteria bacterium]|nr:hypothetical protein [Alphaproteobacteria bacterium]